MHPPGFPWNTGAQTSDKGLNCLKSGVTSALLNAHTYLMYTLFYYAPFLLARSIREGIRERKCSQPLRPVRSLGVHRGKWSFSFTSSLFFWIKKVLWWNPLPLTGTLQEYSVYFIPIVSPDHDRMFFNQQLSFFHLLPLLPLLGLPGPREELHLFCPRPIIHLCTQTPLR